MLDVIRQRRSVRTYLNKDVDKEKLHEILKAAMFSPTARGTRAWEFIVVRDNETKARLSKATPYSAFAKDAPVVIVICHDAGKEVQGRFISVRREYLPEATNQLGPALSR